ncbi:MAG: signal peptidase II [Catenulispora sp.]|nr:signal peptidase II [Catenulispora sp.]
MNPVTPEVAESVEDSDVEASDVEAPAGEASDGAEDSTGAAAPSKPRRLAVLIAMAVLALGLDVVSKILVVAYLTDRDPVHVPGGFLNLTLVRNSGAAFNLGEGQTWVFTIIATAVVVVVLRVARNLRSVPWACALGLLLGGALGNLSDRIFREPGLFRGHVVDFLQFPTFPVVHYDFPVFNLADSSIVVGGCLMVLLSFLGMQPDGTRHSDQSKTDSQ